MAKTASRVLTFGGQRGTWTLQNGFCLSGGGFPVSRPEWGVKRLCPSCSALYYDMGKTPPVCPKCATPYDPEALLKSRRKMVADETRKKVATPAAPEEDVEDIEVAETAGDDAVPPDDDLADDDVAVELETDEDKDL